MEFENDDMDQRHVIATTTTKMVTFYYKHTHTHLMIIVPSQK